MRAALFILGLTLGALTSPAQNVFGSMSAASGAVTAAQDGSLAVTGITMLDNALIYTDGNGNITATAYYGDGSHLSGISGGGFTGNTSQFGKDGSGKTYIISGATVTNLTNAGPITILANGTISVTGPMPPGDYVYNITNDVYANTNWWGFTNYPGVGVSNNYNAEVTWSTSNPTNATSYWFYQKDIYSVTNTANGCGTVATLEATQNKGASMGGTGGGVSALGAAGSAFGFTGPSTPADIHVRMKIELWWP